jgi:hypothetical protein
MTDFAATWNRQIPADRKASVITGLTADAINDYLIAHRIHDAERYIVQREFKDGTRTKLKLTLIVGGNKSDHNNGRAKPLIVVFPTPGTPPVPAEYRATYDFPAEHGSYTVDQIADQLPNVVVSARSINLYMEWPNSEGGSWNYHQDGIDFDLEARLDLVEDDDRFSLRFIPVKLHVSRSSEAALRESISDAIASQSGVAMPAANDPKVADLIMAVVELAATAVGPNLARNIAIPIFEFEKFDASPTAMALSDGVVSVAAHLDFTRAISQASERIAAMKTGLLVAFEQDLAAAGGALEILYDNKVLEQSDTLPPQKRWDFLMSQPTRGEMEIESLLTRSNAFTQLQLQSLHAEMNELTKRMSSAPATANARAREGFGIAINEDTFDRLVADIGGVTRQGYTGRLSLAVIRGRLGYQLRIGTPDITITAANQLQGSIDVDVFAGLYYQVKEILNCSWRWSKEHRIGLGVKGAPKLKVKTVKSNGLSILAQVDLGGLGLQTGLGSAIDKLINMLLSPFRKAIELILNGLLALLSFVVVPAQFAVPDQRAGVRLSRFDTSQYLRHGASGPTNNFLLVKCDLDGVKVG